jgi:hypothetical protein
MTMVSVLHAPALEQYPARREAHLYFMTMLRLAVLEATGMPPPPTANYHVPTPFAKMAQACLDRLHAGANAVELINELQRRRKTRNRANACQVKTPKAAGSDLGYH